MKSIREKLAKGKGPRENKLRLLSGQPPSGQKDEKKEKRRWYQKREYQLTGLGALVTLIILFLLVPKTLFVFPQLQIGKLVQNDIKAPTDMKIPDTVSNQKNKEKAEAEAPAVYDFDLRWADEIGRRVTSAFQTARISFTSGEDREDRQEAFQEKLGASLPPNILNALEDQRYQPLIENRIKANIRPMMETGIVLDKNLLKEDGKKGIILRVVGEGRERFLHTVNSLMDTREARTRLERNVFSNPELNPEQARVVFEVTSALLSPNITFNKSETVLRKQEMVSRIKPLFYEVKKGEILLRSGERVTADHAPLLQEIQKYHQLTTVTQILSGLLLLVIVIVGVFYWDLKQFEERRRFKPSQLILLATILVSTLFLAKFSYFFLSTLADRFQIIEASTISFAFPIAAGAMLVSLLFNIHIGVLSAFTLSLFMGFLVPEENFFILYTFVGCLVAAFSVVKCSRRSGLLRAGFFVGVANVIMVFSINLYESELLSIQSLFELGFGFSGGFLATLVVSALLPLLETVFKVTTDIRLLELLDPNQPLLRDLFLTARGTYYHSMMVSHLAESAAEAIDENPLLARVSCYYHDIGKMLKPEYYIENQMTGPNRHDKLSPNMSSLIIAAHVKDGIELAKSHKLPQPIIDIIPQHHGTRLMKFFFEKAKKDHDPDLPAIKEEDYRYPGPKPQTKIAGIIMLADGVEASSRVLNDPSPARISTHVDKTVTNVFIEGQLDECNLTMNDLRKIKDCFTKVLTGVFHKRIEYPGAGPPFYGEPEHENSDQKPTADPQVKNKEFKMVGRKDSPDAGLS